MANMLFVTLIIAVSMITALSIISLLGRKLPGAFGLICLALTLFTATLFISMFGEAKSKNPDWLLTLFFSILFAIIFLLFVIDYIKHARFLSWSNLTIIGILPVLILIIVWYVLQNGQLNYSFEGIRVADIWLGWKVSLLIYVNSLVIFAVYLLISKLRRLTFGERIFSAVVLLGMCVPVLSSFALVFVPLPLPSLYLVQLGFTVSGCFSTIYCIRTGLVNPPPITRDYVVELMNIGWMVLDIDSRIIDLNPAVERFTGIKRANMIGRPAEDFLSNWPKLINSSGYQAGMEMQGSFKGEDGWRYFRTRISPLLNAQGDLIGRLIIWRDNTYQKAVDDARQRARDEMFILLNSISGAASRAQDINEFLNTAMYQVIYSFNSQMGAIYILDEPSDKSLNRMLLSAHYGLSDEVVRMMYSISGDPELFKDAINGNEDALLIQDLGEDPRVPDILKQAYQKGYLLVLPLATDEKTVGLMLLIRTEGLVFKTDEINRLTVLAQQIAVYVHSQRQRQLAISLSERQRVSRDLHDSVTQKLYGLVTLVEAAQAGLEVGSVISVQALSHIAENARQALREMRLFLHQLHPVDLEREGLVGALHQRMAAVEGRSDIKTKFLADEDLVLSLDAEVALYYIAQEALNNVIKHAHAKSVNVELKKRKTSYTLEIQDDGQGFNPKKDNPGGMGLKNMKERAALINGKLRIESHIGQGTKIVVTIPKGRQK